MTSCTGFDGLPAIPITPLKNFHFAKKIHAKVDAVRQTAHPVLF
ncbi:hypothetical protein B4099_3186 [Heyndrickxia coagulans]|uniref:Uncharacterized protein n=1 Tax=Heyndrickxia coagulans TaxID=1398 RepID=A0A150KHG2_HEYCO|nr:hypothetical protein B4099_3186 [Heyndrickxia coagulans]